MFDIGFKSNCLKPQRDFAGSVFQIHLCSRSLPFLRSGIKDGDGIGVFADAIDTPNRRTWFRGEVWKTRRRRVAFIWIHLSQSVAYTNDGSF